MKVILVIDISLLSGLEFLSRLREDLASRSKNVKMHAASSCISRSEIYKLYLNLIDMAKNRQF